MSRYANFVGDEGHFLCSNTGWGDVLSWSEGVPVEGFEQLVTLCEHGLAQDDLAALLAQIGRARAQFVPSNDVAGILDTLTTLLKANPDAKAIVISDG